MTWVVLARSPDREVAGLLRGWSLSAKLLFNEVGTITLRVPRETTPSGWPAPGCGVILLRDGNVIASGNLDEDQFQWSADPDTDAGGQGIYALTFDTDLGRLAYRTVYPDWEMAWESQRFPYYVHTGNAEEAMRQLVNRQAGSEALSARRVPGLRLGAAAGVGLNTVAKFRFTPLLDALRQLALSGGGLGFDVRDTLDGGQEFSVWQPRDLSNVAVFGIDIGNVIEMDLRRVSPIGTVALVAGADELQNRALREFPDESADSAWGRRELFVDQRQVGKPTAAPGDPDYADQVAEIEAAYRQAAEEALADNGQQTSVSATVVDTPTVQWGRDYGLGDRVRVLTPYGPVVDLVREVDISVSETGVESISSVIGTTNPSVDDPLATTVEKLAARISQLERAQ